MGLGPRTASHGIDEVGAHVDRSLRRLDSQRATLEAVDDMERRRTALKAIASESAALQRYLSRSEARETFRRETTAVIRAAQGVQPLPAKPASAVEPLTAALTLIVALTALKRKLRRVH